MVRIHIFRVQDPIQKSFFLALVECIALFLVFTHFLAATIAPSLNARFQLDATEIEGNLTRPGRHESIFHLLDNGRAQTRGGRSLPVSSCRVVSTGLSQTMAPRDRTGFLHMVLKLSLWLLGSMTHHCNS
jgi:hypothetical protein